MRSEKASMRLALVGSAIPLALFALAGASAVRMTHASAGAAFGWLLRNAELVGFGSLGLLTAMLAFVVTRTIRPFTHVPWDGSWWEFLVFGATLGLWSVLLTIVLVGVLGVLLVLVPFKALYYYALSPEASVGSALSAIPIIFLCVSLLYTLIYMVSVYRGLGAIGGAGGTLFGGSETDLANPVVETFYFSLCTMVGRDPGDLKPSGWCRWIAVSQALVARVLEILIVSIGIGLILLRLGRQPMTSRPFPMSPRSAPSTPAAPPPPARSTHAP